MKKIELIATDWKDIKGYEGLYKINNHGKILNCKTNKIIKVTKHKTHDGNRKVYTYIVTLSKDKKKKSFSIGKLVAEHFVNNPYNYKHIYYIDGNKSNYRSTNIQWGPTTIDTKIVVDGIVFNSLKEYKEFCKRNEQVQYLMNLDEICEIKMPTLKEINAEFKYEKRS